MPAPSEVIGHCTTGSRFRLIFIGQVVHEENPTASVIEQIQLVNLVFQCSQQYGAPDPLGHHPCNECLAIVLGQWAILASNKPPSLGFVPQISHPIVESVGFK